MSEYTYVAHFLLFLDLRGRKRYERYQQEHYTKRRCVSIDRIRKQALCEMAGRQQPRILHNPDSRGGYKIGYRLAVVGRRAWGTHTHSHGRRFVEPAYRRQLSI
jgi:hypothetical protein